MILSRERGNRIWGGGEVSGGGGGVSSSQLAGMLIGYATETWVDEHYISIDFFSRLFQAHGTENGSEIDVIPNDMDTTITSVESMFGFWTNLYISALGSNGAAPAGISLGMLTDVVIGTPSAGQVLTFDAVTQKWVNGNAQAGATALANLTDVTLTSLQTNQILIYDANAQKWVNSSVKTINGYSIFGTGDIPASGGGGNYLPLTGGTLTGWLTVQGTITTTKDSTYSGSAEGGEIIMQCNYNRTYDVHMDCYITAFRIWGNGRENFVVDLQKDENYLVGLTDFVQRSNYWIQGPRIRLGRYHEEILNDRAVIGVSNGNLHIDAYNGYAIYLNFFQNDSSNSAYKKVYFCNNVYYIDGNGYFSGKANYAENLTGKDQYLVSQGLSSNRWSYRMIVGDNTYGHVAFLGTYSNDTFVAGLYGHNAALTAWDSVGIGGTSIRFYLGGNASGNTNGTWNTTGLGVGTDSPSYKLHVAGAIYATGAITALSDARKKDITGETGITVEQIAHAPAVQFLWKDKERRKEGQQVGTLAQYWQTVLPEVVSNKGGELSMQYGVAALVSAIITARKVVDHERRITELEKENERLSKELWKLKFLN